MRGDTITEWALISLLGIFAVDSLLFLLVPGPLGVRLMLGCKLVAVLVCCILVGGLYLRKRDRSD